MERVAGESLESMVKKTGQPLEIEKAFTVADELTGILSYLHSLSPQPLIFRDLKPSNIMMTEKGRLRLIDFGIARYFEPGRQRDTFVYGTPGFSPPEQYGTGQTDARSDIYSLGATLYYLLTLEDPEQFYFNFPSPRNYNSQVPRELQQIILKCLSRNPDERFEHAETLAESIKKARQRALREVEAGGKDIWPGYYFIAAFLVRFLSVQGDRYGMPGGTYAFAIIIFLIASGWIARGVYRHVMIKRHSTSGGDIVKDFHNHLLGLWARRPIVQPSGGHFERGAHK
jgi:serine/threonine protein kinase